MSELALDIHPSSLVLPRAGQPGILRPQLLPTRRESDKPQTRTHITPRHVRTLDPHHISKNLPRRRPVPGRTGQKPRGTQAREAENAKRVVGPGREGEAGRGAVVFLGLALGVGEGEGERARGEDVDGLAAGYFCVLCVIVGVRCISHYLLEALRKERGWLVDLPSKRPRHPLIVRCICRQGSRSLPPLGNSWRCSCRSRNFPRWR